MEYTLEHGFKTNNVYLRIGGLDGYFTLHSYKAFPLQTAAGDLNYPEHIVDWTVMGEILVDGVINFNIPVFPEDRVRDFPQLKQLTGARFKKLKLFYPNRDFLQAQWWSHLADAEQTLRELGGCLITHTLLRY